MQTKIYRFLNKDKEIIYIGLTNDIKRRFSGHDHLQDSCYEEIEYIEYCVFNNSTEASFYEMLLISEYKPKYNKTFNGYEHEIQLPKLEWKEYRNKIRTKRKTKGFIFINKLPDFSKKIHLSYFLEIIHYFYNVESGKLENFTINGLAKKSGTSRQTISNFLKECRNKKVVYQEDDFYYINSEYIK